jgi:hypothetical protein
MMVPGMLTAEEFHYSDKARDWLEAARWPNGPSCPHYGSVVVERMGGKAHRPGLFPLPRLPWSVHGPDRFGDGKQSNPAEQVGSGDPTGYGEQEGHIGPSTPSHAEYHL